MAKSSNYKEKKTSATQKLIDNVKIAKLKSKELKIPISETSLLPTSADILLKHQYKCIQTLELGIQKVLGKSFGKTECLIGLLFHVVQTIAMIFYDLFEVFL